MALVGSLEGKGRMSIPKETRREVNRRNALASTGPRSPEGKARSAMNALRHGAYAEAILVPGEAQEDFDRLRAELGATFQPEGPLEGRLVDRIALLWWRLERAKRVERETLEHALAEARYEAADHLTEWPRQPHG